MNNLLISIGDRLIIDEVIPSEVVVANGDFDDNMWSETTLRKIKR